MTTWPVFDPDTQVRCRNGHIQSDLHRYCSYCGVELPHLPVYAACLHPEYRRRTGCTNKEHQRR